MTSLHRHNRSLIYRLAATCLPLVLLCLAATAQPLASFDQTTRDMGTLLWQQPGVATFTLTNKSTESLSISRVRVDCGCTNVDYPRTPIAPGGTAQIKVVYNAELLGHFNKGLAIYTNLSAEPFNLRIIGHVAEQKAETTEQFPYQIGDYFLSTCNVEFDDVNRGDQPSYSILLYNAGKKSYKPELMHLPKYLTAHYDPEIIRPGRVGRLVLTLDSKKLQNMGLSQCDIYLSRFAGDRVNKETEINVSATLLPNISDLASDPNKVPQLRRDSTAISLTLNPKKQKATGTLLLSNQGNAPLVIKALQVYNPGISVSLGKRTLKPGEQQKMKISVNALSDYFKGRRRILLITNDPEHMKTVVDVTIHK